MRVGLHAQSHRLCLQTALGVTVRRPSLQARAERSEAQALAELGDGVPAHTVPLCTHKSTPRVLGAVALGTLR